jgi:hypothetical protein
MVPITTYIEIVSLDKKLFYSGPPIYVRHLLYSDCLSRMAKSADCSVRRQDGLLSYTDMEYAQLATAVNLTIHSTLLAVYDNIWENGFNNTPCL